MDSEDWSALKLAIGGGFLILVIGSLLILSSIYFHEKECYLIAEKLGYEGEFIYSWEAGGKEFCFYVLPDGTKINAEDYKYIIADIKQQEVIPNEQIG